MTRHPRRNAQNLLTRFNKLQADRFYEAGVWQDYTIYERAAEHATRTPDRIAVRDSHATLSYAELVSLADRMATDFRDLGLVAGDRIAVWLPSRVEMAIFLLVCSRDGYVLCPSLHRNHTCEEIAGLLERAKARVLVAQAGYGADADVADIFKLAEGVESLRRVVRLADPSTRDAAAIAVTLDLPDDGVPLPPSGHPDDVAYLAFTSGTTGEPKGVMHSNNTLLANARPFSADWGFSADSVSYTLSPLSHNLGFGALVMTIEIGGEIVLHDLVRGQSVLDRLRETGTSFVFGVPAHAMDLLREIDEAGAANLDTLKGFRVSGAAAPSSVVEGLLAFGIRPQSGYGMTEAGSHHYTLPDDGPERIVKTSGRVCDGYEIGIFSVEDPNIPLPANQVGQIGGRGGSLMLGYFGNQAATETSFNRDGWFMTGDLGRLDTDGYLAITGRIKDIIIRGGHNIHPARIEQLALRLPAIERAAAIPVKDARLGERVCIVVMPKKDTHIDPVELLDHLRAHGLSKYDMPEYFAEVDEIPLSANGKLLKRALLPGLDNGDVVPVRIPRPEMNT